jgi:subtilisin family serine protease
LGDAGFTTIASRSSSVLGNRQITRLATPPGLSPAQAAALVRQTFPDTIADLSHLYRPAAQPTSVRYAQQLIGVNQVGCVVATRIGLVDTGIGAHAAFRRAHLTQRTFVDLRTGGNLTHGTAVASLLVGELPGVEPLVPGSRVYSANVFAGVQGVLATDVTAIIEALDWMAAARVRVVNLSLIGPPNELLEAAAMGAAQKGMILVAAAGNDGPAAPPAYPAAYTTVIAVSAVDERARPYSNNNRGSYVEIAAPGVDIWAANADGGGAFWTGTSFAVPFVTAALSREVAAGTVSNINDARSYLGASARDLGARGRDPVYGYGLLQARNCGQ